MCAYLLVLGAGVGPISLVSENANTRTILGIVYVGNAQSGVVDNVCDEGDSGGHGSERLVLEVRRELRRIFELNSPPMSL